MSGPEASWQLTRAKDTFPDLIQILFRVDPKNNLCLLSAVKFLAPQHS